MDPPLFWRLWCAFSTSVFLQRINKIHRKKSYCTHATCLKCFSIKIECWIRKKIMRTQGKLMVHLRRISSVMRRWTRKIISLWSLMHTGVCFEEKETDSDWSKLNFLSNIVTTIHIQILLNMLRHVEKGISFSFQGISNDIEATFNEY